MFAVERPANIKVNQLKKLHINSIWQGELSAHTDARRAVVFHFLPSQRKVKRKIQLCVLGVSSAAPRGEMQARAVK